MVSAMFIDICLRNCSLDRISSTYVLYGTHKFSLSYIAVHFVNALYKRKHPFKGTVSRDECFLLSYKVESTFFVCALGVLKVV